jgi:hypothetical protein
MAKSASGLVEGARGLADTVESAILSVPTPKSKQDKSAEKSAAERRKWTAAEDDAMVRKANESFREAAEKEAVRKKARGKLPGAAASSQKKAAKRKTGARKRLTGKR